MDSLITSLLPAEINEHIFGYVCYNDRIIHEQKMKNVYIELLQCTIQIRNVYNNTCGEMATEKPHDSQFMNEHIRSFTFRLNKNRLKKICVDYCKKCEKHNPKDYRIVCNSELFSILEFTMEYEDNDDLSYNELIELMKTKNQDGEFGNTVITSEVVVKQVREELLRSFM